MLPFIKNWGALSTEEKKEQPKAIGVNAAMIEAMDYHIKRYIEHLEENG
ncbi:MAG: arylsulfatase A-like enzyme [Arcticibacterium sp.]|jgi:arylsulfatase A-like enzyme